MQIPLRSLDIGRPIKSCGVRASISRSPACVSQRSGAKHGMSLFSASLPDSLPARDGRDFDSKKLVITITRNSVGTWP